MFNVERHDYPSMRYTSYAGKGMVSTSQPLAAQAGLDMLKNGGNAIDAAVAAAACLTVVEPNNNGIGSDTFALVWTGGKLHGLNASGPAPMAISIEKLAARGFKEMPARGVVPVTVPGAPGAWAELNRRFGRLPLTKVMAPAIGYAEEGYQVATLAAEAWQSTAKAYSAAPEPEVKSWFGTFAPEGKIPRAGDRVRLPDHANTLRRISETAAAEFYQGEYAEKIDHFMREHGGYLRKSDLEAFQPEWVDPVRVGYRGYDVWEIPPNGQGLVALMALNILKGFVFDSPFSEDTLHKQFEAMKLAYTDGKKYITDPRAMKVSVSDLLSDAYADERRRAIGEKAVAPFAGKPAMGGTVYVCAADSEGNMVSLIQSNYMGFGSGVVIPGTGISLQNRGSNFSLDPDHDNCLQPGKRTFHTIIPSFLTKDGEAVGPFGMVGGFMQPQGHVQTIMNTIDFRMSPQQALDAPRWMWTGDLSFQMEGTLPPAVVQGLIGRGHLLAEGFPPAVGFGRGNIIWRMPEAGGFAGACDFRSDGTVASW